MADNKKKYIGLWIKTRDNGTTFLSGKDKDTNTKYFVFKEDDGTSRLVKAVPDGKLETIGDLAQKSNDKGEYMQLGDFFVGENPYYTDQVSEEGYTKPEYTLSFKIS